MELVFLYHFRLKWQTIVSWMVIFLFTDIHPLERGLVIFHKFSHIYIWCRDSFVFTSQKKTWKDRIWKDVKSTEKICMKRDSFKHLQGNQLNHNSFIYSVICDNKNAFYAYATFICGKPHLITGGTNHLKCWRNLAFAKNALNITPYNPK